jgi:hypothetical protein
MDTSEARRGAMVTGSIHFVYVDSLCAFDAAAGV